MCRSRIRPLIISSKARLTLKDDPKGATFGLVSSPSEVTGNANDVVLDTSPAYITAIDGNTVDISFGEETFERDGETVTEWVKERELYFMPLRMTMAPSPLMILSS